MRLIDADVLKRCVGILADKMTDSGAMAIKQAVNIAESLPSIDIVFCKECKYAHMTYGGDCKYCDMWKDDDDFCIELYLDGDFYCSYGEREGE